MTCIPHQKATICLWSIVLEVLTFFFTVIHYTYMSPVWCHSILGDVCHCLHSENYYCSRLAVFWIRSLITVIADKVPLTILLILTFYFQSFVSYHYPDVWISPCELIIGQSFSSIEPLLLCCFIWCAHIKRAWGRKTMLSALTHLPACHWGIRHQRGRVDIFPDIVVPCRNFGRLRLLWHTWWSATLREIIPCFVAASIYNVLNKDLI